MAGALLESTLDLIEHFWTTLLAMSPFEVAVLLVLLLFPGGLCVAIHEAGHAIVAFLVGVPVREIRVGETDDVVVRAGALRMRFGRIESAEHVAPGEVWTDNGSAKAWQLIAVFLAGCAANLAAAGVSIPLALSLHLIPEGMLLYWAGLNVYLAVVNLWPRGDLDEMDSLNDGASVRLIWTHRHLLPLPEATPAEADPRLATSFPPPPVRHLPEGRS